MNNLSAAQLNKLSSYVGLPYESEKDGPDSFDCTGLISVLYFKLFGIKIDIQPSDRKSVICIDGRPVQAGDLLFFRTGYNLHVGMAIDNKRMIHADENIGYVIIERFKSRLWEHRLKHSYRHKALL